MRRVAATTLVALAGLLSRSARGETIPIELPLPSTLAADYQFQRELDQPVSALLVQHGKIWVRSAVPGQAERIHRFDGTQWHQSVGSVISQDDPALDFIAGLLPSPVLAGIYYTCCGNGGPVVRREQGERWISAAINLPDTEFPGPLAVAATTQPIICSTGSASVCQRWISGKSQPIASLPSPLPQLAGAGSTAIGFAEDRLYKYHGKWIPLGEPFPHESVKDVTAIRLGTSGRVWFIHERGFSLWDGVAHRAVPVPIAEPTDLVERSPTDVWVGGSQSVAHFDGESWRVQAGVYGSDLRLALGDNGELWVGSTTTGLWRGKPAADAGTVPKRLSLTEAQQQSLPAVQADSPPWGHFDTAIVTLDHGDTQLRQARSMIAHRGVRYLYDGSRLHASIPAKEIFARPASPLGPYACSFGCLAPAETGIAELTTGILRITDLNGQKELLEQVAYPTAVSTATDETLWVVGNGELADRFTVGRSGPTGMVLLDRYPSMAPQGVFAVSESEAWIAGATTPGTATHPELGRLDQTQPGGPGLLDHVHGTTVDRYALGAGILTAVGVTSNGDVVAAGESGLIVELHRGTQRVWQLPSRPFLYAVVVLDDCVWVLGEHGVLLRRKAGVWTRVPTPGYLGRAYTSLIRDGDRWLAAGPESILEIRERGSRPDR